MKRVWHIDVFCIIPPPFWGTTDHLSSDSPCRRLIPHSFLCFFFLISAWTCYWTNYHVADDLISAQRSSNACIAIKAYAGSSASREMLVFDTGFWNYIINLNSKPHHHIWLLDLPKLTCYFMFYKALFGRRGSVYCFGLVSISTLSAF